MFVPQRVGNNIKIWSTFNFKIGSIFLTLFERKLFASVCANSSHCVCVRQKSPEGADLIRHMVQLIVQCVNYVRYTCVHTYAIPQSMRRRDELISSIFRSSIDQLNEHSV